MEKVHNHPNAALAAPQRTARGSHSGGLHTPGLLAQLPVIGLLMVLFGGGLFGALAISLQTQSPLMQTDMQIVTSLHVIALHSSPFIVGIMIFGFYMGQYVIIAIGAVLVVYFLHKRFWTELSMVGIAWGGEAVLWLVISDYFNRPRPTFAVEVWHQMTVPSFPSGHSFGAVLCYGFLAYMLVPKMPSRFWKVVVILAALLIILYVGFSRVFVGDHYPTDVLAGYAIGIAWGGLVYTSIELISARYRKRKVSVQ